MWGIALIVILVGLVVMGAKGGRVRYIYVPEGESWKKVFYETVVNPKKEREASAPSRTLFYFGAAFVLVAVLLVVFL